MRRAIIGCLLGAVVACSGGPAETGAAAKPSPVAAAASPLTASSPAGSCAGTPFQQGAQPTWLDAAGGHNNPTGLLYVMDASQTVAGFLFGYPLRAGHPENPANKILWVVGLPRNGSDLVITGHPARAAVPVVRVTQPADSGPGEIYPSIVDMPTSGCWVLDLAWANHTATLQLPYR